MGVNDQNLENVVNTGNINNPGRDNNTGTGSNNINNNNTGGDIDNINNNNIYQNVPDQLKDYCAGRTAEERQTLTSIAGQASVESRRRKKSFQERMQALWNTPMSRETAAAVLGDDTERFFPEGEPAAGDLGMARMLQETWNGNAKAAEFMRDTAGYKPVQEVSLEVPEDEGIRALLEKAGQRIRKDQNEN